MSELSVLQRETSVHRVNSTNALNCVKLTALMKLTSGSPEVTIGLIDGPVNIDHPDLASENIREIPRGREISCAHAGSAACMHGTFVAGMLSGKRESLAPAICPNCTLQVRPIFAETTRLSEKMPSATPEELATAIIDCTDAGVRVINLSAGLRQPSSKGQRELEEALSYAAKRGVIVVAAAGNQGTIGSSTITRHPGVIPVVACDVQDRPMGESNLGSSIGRRGLRAPGDSITSLGTQGMPVTLGGTSVAAPFVTGTIALLWSQFSDATPTEVRLAVTQSNGARRTTIVPPLLDAWAAYDHLSMAGTADRRLHTGLST